MATGRDLCDYLQMSKTSILFVCMGNICRSPTAEGVFRQRAEKAGMAGWLEIDSAGTHAYHVGNLPDPRSSASTISTRWTRTTSRA